MSRNFASAVLLPIMPPKSVILFRVEDVNLLLNTSPPPTRDSIMMFLLHVIVILEIPVTVTDIPTQPTVIVPILDHAQEDVIIITIIIIIIKTKATTKNLMLM
jgi:hypothetical protein